MQTVMVNDLNFTHEPQEGIYDDALKMNMEQKMSIGYLSKPGYCFSPDEKTESIYETMKLNPAITEFTIVKDNCAIGFLTRTALNEILGGKYGFSLYSKNPIMEIMKTDFLSVDYFMPVDHVSKLAMQRSFDLLYNPIVVEQEGKYAGIVTVKDLLDTCTKMALAERNEIALMRDSLKIGLFFMDRGYIIQDQYSRYLEELLSRNDLHGMSFIDILASSVTPNELKAIKDYFDMLIERSFDQSMLDDINPLMELHYADSDPSNRKVFQCGFATIERNNGDVFVLVSVYDITARVQLQRRLTEEENKRHEEMKIVFELIQVEPEVFRDFLDDTEYEFERINKTLKNDTMSSHEALVEIYQSVHAIKSNAVILGQNTFGSKVHDLETIIKKLREQGDVSFTCMLNLAMEIEKLIQEKDKFNTTIQKINSLKFSGGDNRKQAQYVLLESLTRTVSKASADMGKKVKFVVDRIDNEAIEKGPRRVIKEVLIQFIRNSVVHGIESPQERSARGKSKTGIIRLSIKMEDGKVHVKLGDDGRGLDYEKIAKKALRFNLIKPENSKDKDALLKVIFSPGFSTAENEGVHAGRGIGLNLVQERIRSGKGSLKVKSEQGEGTTFHVFFPLS